MMWSNCYFIDELKETLNKLIFDLQFYIFSLVAVSQPDCKASDPTAKYRDLSYGYEPSGQFNVVSDNFKWLKLYEFFNHFTNFIQTDYYTSRNWFYYFFLFCFSSRLEEYEYIFPEIHAWKDCLCIKEVRQGILDAPLCLYASYHLHLGT